ELPRELLFERFVSCKTALTCEEVERTYGSGDELGTKALDHHFKNLFICEDANLTTEKIEKIILKSELKIGSKPKLVIIDYVQLIRSTGEGRYEKASNVAEDLKRIARSTGTVIIVASQRSRPEKQRSDKSPPRIEVGLHDAKESGSLENSSGVVIGAWRDRSDASCVWLRVLKSTKGGAGKTTACNFNGEHMKITERANCP
ncbi:MAG: DnaB-like helicase C-terminal domain-containing protein, partial [Pantoea agglomerans]